MTKDALEQSYDELPYQPRALRNTHPLRLRAAALAAGLDAAPAENCRLLELGCASGMNLIAMAEQLPGCRFVGVDLAETQIARGRAVADALSLGNLDLRARSLLDVGPELGTFDYIVFHGVYSWVAPEVRDRLLQICAQNLAPDGIVYLSYNVFPGWHARQMLREMMLYHTRNVGDTRKKVDEARAFVEMLVRAIPTRDLYQRVVAEQAAHVRGSASYYVAHEHLEVDNQPVYFHQLVEHAERHGLAYVGDAEVQPSTDDLPPDAQEALAAVAGDPIRFEQYLDFLKCGTFRRSVFCRAGRAIARAWDPSRLDGLYLGALAEPQSPAPRVDDDTLENFRAPNATVATDGPLFKAMLVSLHASLPRVLTLAELWHEVTARLGPPPFEEELEIRAALRDAAGHLYRSSLLELSAWAPPFCAVPSERPTARPLARLEAAESPTVTNLRHVSMDLLPLERALVRELDGTQDAAQLAARLRARPDEIAAALDRLARAPLLIA